MSIKSTFDGIPAAIKYPVVIGLMILVLIGAWRYGSKAWNGIGNVLFAHQINAKQAEVQKELDQAAKDKQALQQTLLELKQAKEDYAREKAAREAAEKLFYDQSKTSAEKVAEYKQALAAAPTHTSTDNITIEDLCARAKAANSNPQLIAALCAN